MDVMKTLKVASWMGLYLAEASAIAWRERDENHRLSTLAANVSRYSRRGLRSLNIDVQVNGLTAEKLARKNYLMVSNHMSYLDILIMAAVRPSLFVTSVDMGEKFFIGKMIEMAGCIQVERRNRERVELDKSSIVRALKAGHNVVLYPEGTSTDGSQILPFKKSLLPAAAEAGVDILPVVLKYRDVNGEEFGPANRDKLCWYGSMSFLPHLLGVTSLKSVTAEIRFLDPVKVMQDSTRDELAAKSFSAISTAYFEPDLGFSPAGM
jgi:1-acyl-sn-glycerol-3-phosphate acyltransferase